MTTELVENSVIIPEDEESVVKYLVITTREVVRIHALEMLASLSQSPLFFISFNIDVKRVVTLRNKKKQFGTLNPTCQYHYIRHTLTRNTFILNKYMDEAIIIFEQTGKGNIHFHVLYRQKDDYNKKYVQTAICDLFGISKWEELIHTCDIQEITDYQGIYEYMFYKHTKKYEELDMSKYCPLILK